jgi:hypothetical protein
MFRRRKAEVEVAATDSAEEAEEVEARTGPRAEGPWDVSEVDIPEDDQTRVDLGSLLVTPHEGLDVQLQVDETSGQVAAVIMAGEHGAVELRAFAAPRNGDIWDDVRRQVAGEVARLGGTATEAEGAWGTELRVALTVALGCCGPRCSVVPRSSTTPTATSRRPCGTSSWCAAAPRSHPATRCR